MNLTQIQDVLNKMLSASPSKGQQRNIVFWYDDEGEFKDRIGEIKLWSAKMLTINNNSFYIKYLVETQEPETNFLIYCPGPKPEPRDNFLVDMLLYSEEFSTDSTTLVMRDLKIDPSLRGVIKKYTAFFGDKGKYNKFASYGLTKYSESIIDTAVLSALLKLPAPNLELVFRTVIADGLLGDGQLMADIAKYGDINAFWRLARAVYAYPLDDQDLKLLTMSLFLKHMSVTFRADLPNNLKKFIGESTADAFVFVENFMGSPQYVQVANLVAEALNLASLLEETDTECFITTGTFPLFDKVIIARICRNLVDQAGEYEKYKEQIKARRKSNFYSTYENEYGALYYATELLSLEQDYGNQIPGGSVLDLYNRYKSEFYKFDTYYRKFVLHYDRIENTDLFLPLFELVENTYVNFFLSELAVKWESASTELQSQWKLFPEISQHHFCTMIVADYLENIKEKLFVVISDGLRYEVGKELAEILNGEHKAMVTLETMFGVLPSYTALGMAALLPGTELAYNDKGEVLLDGASTKGTESRASILRGKYPKSACLSFDEIKNMSKADLRAQTVGRDLVYIYHNTIDGCGDNTATQKQVFAAVEQAIEELSWLVRKLKNDVSATNIVITADHGFIYRRTDLSESDKTPRELISYLEANRRFILTTDTKEIEGTSCYSMDYLMKDSGLAAVVPKGINCYKVPGKGKNYVHGGASLQEIVIPVIRFRHDRSSSDKLQAKKVSVALTSLTRKITSMITYLEFFQTEVVGDKWQPLRLKAYFVDEEGNRISNENIIIADSRSDDFARRTFKEKFTLKSGNYDKTKPYYLVLIDEKDKVGDVIDKIEFSIDLIFQNDFGF